MIACLRLPHFAATLEAHAHPELRNKPFVLLDNTCHEHIADISPQAAKAGVRATMPLPQARARCPDLLVRPAVRSRAQHMLNTLLDRLTAFTAHVEAEDGLELRADSRRWRNVTFLHPAQLDDYPAVTCYLDLGTVPPEEASSLAQQLHTLVGEQVQMPAKVGLSSGRFPARVAATAVNLGDTLIVPPKHEADFLAGFTVALLPVDGETLRQFDLLGWHTLGDVAVQPVAALVSRFGKHGHIIHRLAHGRDTQPVQEYVLPIVARIQHAFDAPETQWDRLDAVLAEMAASATAALLADNQTVRHITLVLALEDGTIHEQELTLRQPSRSLNHIQTCVQEMAQALTISCGVVEAEVTLSDITPAVPKQLSLFRRPAVSHAHLNSVLTDLAARYGDSQFYWVRGADRASWLPERRYRWDKAGD